MGWVVGIKYPCLSAEYFPLIFTQNKQQYENNATPTRVLFNYNVEKPLEASYSLIGAI